MQQFPEEPNISIRISRFNNILKSVASLHVCKTKLSKKPKPWINPEICNCNQLCHYIHQNREEWIDAYREEKVAINKAKTSSWKDLLHSSMSNAGGPDVWKVIRSFNGTQDTNLPSEAMSHNDRTIIDTKSKAKLVSAEVEAVRIKYFKFSKP